MKGLVISLSALLLIGAGCTWSASVDTEQSGRYGAPQEQESPTEDRTVSGVVASVNLDAIALDGPAVVTVQTESEGNVEVHVPSFGINLCAASSSIADVYTMKAGAEVEVRGTVSEDGAVVPCQSNEHYLRVVAD